MNNAPVVRRLHRTTSSPLWNINVLEVDLTASGVHFGSSATTQRKKTPSAFAKLVGANVKTIQAWEQGKPPPPMARRLLDCIAKDLAPWEKILREAAVTKAR
jgi:hypothetical protein